MPNGEENVLEVVSVTDEMEARDGRRFKTIGVIPFTKPTDPISTTRVHKRNVWSGQPLGGELNPYYDKIKPGVKIRGKIVHMNTKEYYIPNERGRYVCTSGEFEGQRFNKANTKTYVTLEDETAEQLRRNDGLDPRQTAEESAQYGVSITDIEVRPLTSDEMRDTPRITYPDEQRRRQFERSVELSRERERQLQEAGEYPYGEEEGEENQGGEESIT